MAKLRFEDGSQVRDFDTIVAALAPLGIILHRAPLADDRELRLLLDRPVLTSDEKARVLAALERQIEGLTVAQGGGLRSRRASPRDGGHRRVAQEVQEVPYTSGR